MVYNGGCGMFRKLVNRSKLSKLFLFLVLMIVGSIILSGAVSAGNTVIHTPALSHDTNISSNSLKTNTTATIKPASRNKVGSTSYYGDPIIYGDKVVFESSPYAYKFDVYMWDLKGNKITPISNSNDMEEAHPRIWGHNLVWSENLPLGTTLYPVSSIIYHDMNTKTYQTLAVGDDIPKNPSIYGSSVVWTSYRYINYFEQKEFVWLGGPGKTNLKIATGTTPDIYGNNIVYIDVRNNLYGLYLYNISSRSERLLSSSSGQMGYPRINGNNVVWVDTRTGSADIWMYNLATNRIKDISPFTSGQYEPAIWGDNIVYADNRHGNYDIYGYNIKTGKTSRLTSASSDERHPSIYQNIFVYTDSINIFYKYIDNIAPKVSSTTPTNLKTAVRRISTIAIKFSEKIKYGIYSNRITIKNLKTNKYVTIKKAISGNILYLKTSTTRSKYTWYQVTIPKAAIKDYTGNNLSATYKFKFKTRA